VGLCALALVAGNAAGTAVVREHLAPGVCAALHGGRQLFLECRLPQGEAVRAFLVEYLADPDQWTTYKGRNAVAIRYDQLAPQVQRDVLLAVFKQDAIDGCGWWHTVMFGGEEGQETLWSLCEWVTGRGTNYRKVLADPRNAHLKEDIALEPGQRVLIPAPLLPDAMRAFTPKPAARDEYVDLEPVVNLSAAAQELAYGTDAQGAYALYRLRPGEALYTAVVVRFTDYSENASILEACEVIRRRSGIRDVHEMKPGQKVLIPLDMLSDQFRPEGSERREQYEQAIIEAKRLRKEHVHSKDLSGVVVVIDPGHGGRDHGAPKPEHGLYEDEINYDIACRVKRILDARTQAKVYMTLIDPSQGYACVNCRRFVHDTDEELLTTPHYENTDAKVSANLRWYLANRIYREEQSKGTDPRKIVFTSFHTDALFNARLRGAMIYIPGARYRRDRERPPGSIYARFQEARAQPCATSTAAERRRDEALSRNLAEDLIAALGKRRIRRHLEGPWIRAQIRQDGGQVYVPTVLRNTQIPTKILVESANITNETDCKRLANPEWRQTFAEAYVDALKTYYGS